MNPFPENTQDLKDDRAEYIQLIEEYIEEYNWNTNVKEMMSALVSTVNNVYVNDGSVDIYEMIELSKSLISSRINNAVVTMGEESRKNIAQYL
jgi:metal-responsive CopG/Arc/MetJ family transcriptional regulator